MSVKENSYRLFLALILALTVTFVWSAAAYAVTPEDVQYGSPTGSVGDTTGTGGSGGSVGGSGSLALVGTTETGDAPAASGSVGLTGLLPETGGPLFSLVALASAALIGTGLILLRYNLKSS